MFDYIAIAFDSAYRGGGTSSPVRRVVREDNKNKVEFSKAEFKAILLDQKCKRDFGHFISKAFMSR